MKNSTVFLSNIERKNQIISLNENLSPYHSKRDGIDSGGMCSNHHKKRASYYRKNSHSKRYCGDCALKLTMGDSQFIPVNFLNKDEIRKKSGCESFLRRLSLYTSCLGGHIERNERLLTETTHRYDHDVNRIGIFFDKISNIISDVYQRLLNDKTLLLKSIEKEHLKKKEELSKHLEEVQKYINDVSGNIENIVIGMKMEPYEDIMTKYSQRIDAIQEYCEQRQLEEYPIYKEIIEHPKQIEEVNTSLQSCINKIVQIFEPNLPANSSKSSLLSSQLDSVTMNEELKKIKGFFYSNNGKLNFNRRTAVESKK